MRPTRSSVLLALALLAGIISWLAVTREYNSLPALPIIGPLTLVILAIAELMFAFSVRGRIRNPNTPVQRRLEPIFVARLAVLAKASSHAAAVVAGLYGGFLVYTLTHLGKPKINSDSRASGLSLVAALALVAAAIFLEFSCRVPRPPDEEHRRAHRPVA
jgi:FtsH-binding integral membrane protein